MFIKRIIINQRGSKYAMKSSATSNKLVAKNLRFQNIDVVSLTV